MAPFVRGERGARGKVQSASRGKNRVHRPSRGGGRGRGSSATNTKDRSTFYSTRIEEHADDDANPPLEAEGPAVSDDEDVSDASDDSNSDVDLDSERTHTNPYSTLLLSLNAKTQDGPSQRKKQKLDKEVSKETHFPENHERQLEHQNGHGTTSEDGLDDQSDTNEANISDGIEEEDAEEIEDGRLLILSWLRSSDVCSIHGRSLSPAHG